MLIHYIFISKIIAIIVKITIDLNGRCAFKKMTGENPEVRSDKEKPREKRERKEIKREKRSERGKREKERKRERKERKKREK